MSLLKRFCVKGDRSRVISMLLFLSNLFQAGRPVKDNGWFVKLSLPKKEPSL